MSENKLSVIVPVYNEEKSLENNINILQQTLESIHPDYEIIISEDGSTDDTKSICYRLAEHEKVVTINFDERLGKGKAVKNALAVSTGKRVVITDADLSVHPRQIADLLSGLDEGYDLVIGSRYMKGSTTGRNVFSTIKSKFYNMLVRYFIGTDISDHQCGFKAFNQNHIGDVLNVIETDNFFYDTDLIVRTIESGQKIKEIPVDWVEATGRVSHVSFEDEIAILVQMKKFIEDNHWKNKDSK